MSYTTSGGDKMNFIFIDGYMVPITKAELSLCKVGDLALLISGHEATFIRAYTDSFSFDLSVSKECGDYYD